MEMGMLRIGADDCCDDEGFTGERLLKANSADTSGMCYGRV